MQERTRVGKMDRVLCDYGGASGHSTKFNNSALDRRLRAKARMQPGSSLARRHVRRDVVAPPRGKFGCRCRELPPEDDFYLGKGEPDALPAFAQQALAQRIVDRIPNDCASAQGLPRV